MVTFYEPDSMLTSYAIDTSSIIAVSFNFPNTRDIIWTGIIELIEADRLKSVAWVLTELERNADAADGAHLRLEPYIDHFLWPWQQFLPRAGQLAQMFPPLAPHNNPNNKADTLIIALAEAQGLTVVCNETRLRARRMPAACEALGVPCLNVADFVRRERLEFTS